MAFPARAYATVTPAEVTPINRGKPTAAQHEAARAAELDQAEAIDCVCEVLDRLELRVANYKAAIALLKERQRVAEARIERIEAEVLDRMVAAGTQRATGFKRWCETKLTPAKVEVDDESQLPGDYLRETITTAPDKAKIKAVLQRAQANRPTAQDLAEAAKLGCCRLTQSTTLVRH